jgi:succinylarginine dihydrolase
MPLLTIITITNTSKTVLIIYSLILFKAKQVFKEIHNFINKFIFYNIPGLKVYISDQGAGFILATKKLVKEDI